MFAMFGQLRLIVEVVSRFLCCVLRLLCTGRWPSVSAEALESKMDASKEYSTWRAHARLLDELEGLPDWREAPEPNFPLDLVEARIRMLMETRKEGNPQELLKVLRADIHRSTYGITNAKLYPYRTATKTWISTYVNLMQHLIRVVGTDEAVAPTARYRAVKDMQLAYGTSALLLNGGVALGAYHLGVVRGLFEAKLLPNVIFGCNTGALVAACLCCFEDILSVIDGDAVDFAAFAKRGSSGSLKRKWNRLKHEGTLMDVQVLLQFAKDNLGDITFAEAFKKTGRVLNISVDQYMGKEQKGAVGSWLLNYLTTPNVLVYTAAVASCATAYVYGSTPLLAKSISGKIVLFDPPALRFSDRLASFHINDAVERLREQFNVRLTIVSECSVTRLPFLRLEHRDGFVARLGHFVAEEVWRLAAFLSRLPVFRGRMTGSLQRISDRVKGDIIIFPASTFGDLLKLLNNPDKTLLDYCVWRGQLQLWPKMPMLKTHICIEVALLQALRQLEQQFPWLTTVHESPSARGRRLLSVCPIEPMMFQASSLKTRKEETEHLENEEDAVCSTAPFAAEGDSCDVHSR